MIRITHPDFEHSACSAINAEECLLYLHACGWVHPSKAMLVIFLGCGCAASETSLVLTMLQQGYNIKKAIFMDYDVCSSAISNIQDLMRNSNVQCGLAATYTCLCSEVLRQSFKWDKILVIGIHTGLRFSTDEQLDEYLCFLEQCRQLANKNIVQAEFVNLQHLDWTCCVPDARFHCTQDSSSLWVYHTSWEQQLLEARQLHRKPIRLAPPQTGQAPNQLTHRRLQGVR